MVACFVDPVSLVIELMKFWMVGSMRMSLTRVIRRLCWSAAPSHDALL